ncbi:MAG: alpha/beta hydrolase [Candidatus Competibacteraceae bacterium]|nr:alpha/beta hydrolase [Candidatus Competibacteraceae bacterium]
MLLQSEQSVFFSVGPLRLEGRLSVAPGPKAVIVTHPHPLYGGDLANPVVATLVKVYQRQRYTTLRFNFRGVGGKGSDTDGRGEQDDLRAAAAYLSALDKTVTELAGYSFGTWINLRLNPPLATVRRQLAVAPPVALLAFDAVTAPPHLSIVVGDRDDFAPLATLREQLAMWRATARLQVLPNVDHFFGNGLDRLAEVVEAILLAPPD